MQYVRIKTEEGAFLYLRTCLSVFENMPFCIWEHALLAWRRRPSWSKTGMVL